MYDTRLLGYGIGRRGGVGGVYSEIPTQHITAHKVEKVIGMFSVKISLKYEEVDGYGV